MRERGTGQILQVSSVASALTSGTYAAHKAWLKVFAESYASDLRRHGVVLTVTLPGLVHTDFHRRAGLDYSDYPRWVWIPADVVVRQSLAAVRRGRAVVVPTVRYRVLLALMRAVPRPLIRRLGRTRVDA
jgi:hypothetical protein